MSTHTRSILAAIGLILLLAGCGSSSSFSPQLSRRPQVDKTTSYIYPRHLIWEQYGADASNSHKSRSSILQPESMQLLWVVDQFTDASGTTLMKPFLAEPVSMEQTYGMDVPTFENNTSIYATDSFGTLWIIDADEGICTIKNDSESGLLDWQTAASPLVLDGEYTYDPEGGTRTLAETWIYTYTATGKIAMYVHTFWSDGTQTFEFDSGNLLNRWDDPYYFVPPDDSGYALPSITRWGLVEIAGTNGGRLTPVNHRILAGSYSTSGGNDRLCSLFPIQVAGDKTWEAATNDRVEGAPMWLNITGSMMGIGGTGDNNDGLVYFVERIPPAQSQGDQAQVRAYRMQDGQPALTSAPASLPVVSIPFPWHPAYVPDGIARPHSATISTEPLSVGKINRQDHLFLATPPVTGWTPLNPADPTYTAQLHAFPATLGALTAQGIPQPGLDVISLPLVFPPSDPPDGFQHELKVTSAPAVRLNPLNDNVTEIYVCGNEVLRDTGGGLTDTDVGYLFKYTLTKTGPDTWNFTQSGNPASFEAFGDGGRCWSSPTLDDANHVLLNTEERLFVLDADNLNTLYYSGAIGTDIRTSPIIDRQQRVYVLGSGPTEGGVSSEIGAVYCFGGEAYPKPYWQQEGNSPYHTWNSDISLGGVPSADSTFDLGLFGLDLNGDPVVVKGEPVVDGFGRIYYTATDGYLRRWNPNLTDHDGNWLPPSVDWEYSANPGEDYCDSTPALSFESEITEDENPEIYYTAERRWEDGQGEQHNELWLHQMRIESQSLRNSELIGTHTTLNSPVVGNLGQVHIAAVDDVNVRYYSCFASTYPSISHPITGSYVSSATLPFNDTGDYRDAYFVVGHDNHETELYKVSSMHKHSDWVVMAVSSLQTDWATEWYRRTPVYRLSPLLERSVYAQTGVYLFGFDDALSDVQQTKFNPLGSGFEGFYCLNTSPSLYVDGSSGYHYSTGITDKTRNYLDIAAYLTVPELNQSGSGTQYFDTSSLGIEVNAPASISADGFVFLATSQGLRYTDLYDEQATAMTMLDAKPYGMSAPVIARYRGKPCVFVIDTDGYLNCFTVE